MKEQISKLYSEYGRYINKFRAFPLIYDGLKIVERRILYSLFLRAKDKFVKSAEVVGWCIGQYHPHGDVSTYGSMAQLVNGGLAIGQGNWGSYTGITSNEPAAMRYTEVKSSKKVLDMAFEYIDYVDKDALELYEEPVYLACKLPMCLVNTINCQGIGFGFRTFMPSYDPKDLIKRLEWLLGRRQEEPIIKPLTASVHLSKDEDFRQLLTTGKAKLTFRGKSSIDRMGNSVIVTTMPEGKTFLNLLKKLEKEIQVQKTIGFVDESTTTTKVRFAPVKRSVDVDTLYNLINYNLTSSVSYECNMCDTQGNVKLVSIDDMLMTVYKVYEETVKKYLVSQIDKLQASINELDLIARIKVSLIKWIKIYPDDMETLMSKINEETQVDIENIKELFGKYTITKLLKIKTDRQDLVDKQTQFKNDLGRLADYVWESKYQPIL